jgi:hypothetical protein
MKWQDSPVSKTKHSQYAQEALGTWDVVFDQSNSNTVEVVVRKGAQVCYLKYSPSTLEKVPEVRRAKELAQRIDFFEDLSDFRAFAEVRNDNRLRKITL